MKRFITSKTVRNVTLSEKNRQVVVAGRSPKHALTLTLPTSWSVSCNALASGIFAQFAEMSVQTMRALAHRLSMWLDAPAAARAYAHAAYAGAVAGRGLSGAGQRVSPRATSPDLD